MRARQKQPAKITLKSAAATKSEPRFSQTERRLHQDRIFTFREPQVRARQFEPVVRVAQSNVQRAFNTFVAYASHRDGLEGFKHLWAAPTVAAATVLGLFALLILLDEHLGMRRMLAVAPLSWVNDVARSAEGWIKKAPEEAPFVEDNSQTTLFGPATKQATTRPKGASFESKKETSGASVSPDPSVASSEAVAESTPAVREQIAVVASSEAVADAVREQIAVLPPPALEGAGVRGRVSREESVQARIEVVEPRTEVIQPRAEVAKAAPRERVDPVPERSALATAIDKRKVLIEEQKSAFLSKEKKTQTSELQERGAAGAKKTSSQGAFAEDNPAINLSAKKLSSQPSTIILNKSVTPTKENADVSQQGSIAQGTVHDDGGHTAAPGNARRTESQVARNAEIKRDEPGNTAGVAPITSIIERVAESESVKKAERRPEPGTSERGTTKRAEVPVTVAPVVETPTIVAPVVRVEVPAEVTSVKRVDRPVAATPGERAETPAAVTPVQRVETPVTLTPVQRVETPAIVAPVERVETPTIVAPIDRVETPAAVAPVQRVETPVIVAPIDRVETPAVVAPVQRVETPTIVAPIDRVEMPTVVVPVQRVETPVIVTPIDRVETPAAVAPVQRVETPVIVAPIDRVETPAAVAPVQRVETPTIVAPIDRVEIPTVVAPVARVERHVAVVTIQRIERLQVAAVPQRVERPVVERAPVQRHEKVERSVIKAEKPPDRPNKPHRPDRLQRGKS